MMIYKYNLMENFRNNTEAVDGKVVIDVPETMREKDLKVIAVARDETHERWADLPPERRIEILKKYTGSAKFPKVEIRKSDVYNQ